MRKFWTGALTGAAVALAAVATSSELIHRWVCHRMKQAGKVF